MRAGPGDLVTEVIILDSHPEWIKTLASRGRGELNAPARKVGDRDSRDLNDGYPGRFPRGRQNAGSRSRKHLPGRARPTASGACSGLLLSWQSQSRGLD